MTQDHANVGLLKQLDIGNIPGNADLFSEDFIWHYFNPKLPEIQGDYVGLAGLRDFFQNLGSLTRGTFKSEPQSVTAYGDELVVAHARNTLAMDGRSLEIDAIVVWRIVGGRIVEAWDIPSVYTVASQTND